MFTWLKKLLHGRAAHSPVLQVPLAPEWTQENQAELRKFLSSKTGQTLLKKARAMEANYAVKACLNGSPDPKLVGGISFTLDWLVKLIDLPEATAVRVANTEASHWQNADVSLPEFATV
jgi:hypothetical protein